MPCGRPISDAERFYRRELGALLAARRRASGLSRLQTAILAGCSPALVGFAELGLSPPSTCERIRTAIEAAERRTFAPPKAGRR